MKCPFEFDVRLNLDEKVANSQSTPVGLLRRLPDKNVNGSATCRLVTFSVEGNDLLFGFVMFKMYRELDNRWMVLVNAKGSMILSRPR